MIDADMKEDSLDPEDVSQPIEIDPTDESVEIPDGHWSLEAVRRVDRSGESLFEIKEASVTYVEIGDNSHLDPPQQIPFSRPTVRTEETHLNSN